MRSTLLIAGSLLVVSFCVGVLTAPTGSVANIAAQSASIPPQLTHPGRQLAHAALRLERLTPAPIIAEAAPKTPAAKPAAPPPINVAEQFRRDLSAVLDTNNAPVVVLVDVTQPGQRRSLQRGDKYRDGWRIHHIDADHVLLRRGGETLFVRIASAYPLDVSPGELASETMADQQIAEGGAPGRRRLQLSRKAARGGM